MTISPSLPSYSESIISLSASLSLCNTTCLAVCAAILPALLGMFSVAMVSPTSAVGLKDSRASETDISCKGSSTVSTTVFIMST